MKPCVKPYPLLVVAFALAACAPVVYVTPGAGGELLPEQIQRAADAYTATARVMATQAAQATGTGVAARETATGAAQGTLGALAAQQTDVALELTQGAALAAATDAAGVKTQSAGQTQAWATPTAAALVALVRATATAAARSEAKSAVDLQRAQDVATARAWLLLIVGILFLAGLASALIFGLSDLLSARARLISAEAALAEVQARQLWVMQFGGALLQLRNDVWELMQLPPAGGPVTIDAAAASPVREVPIRAKSGVTTMVQLGQAETPERERVLHLLDRAITIAGAGAALIPSAERLGMHPQDWQLAVDRLKASADQPAYVVARVGRPKAGQGGGTRLCHPAYLTLGALRDGVKRGDVLPRPDEDHAGAEAGNIQNLHFETS